MSSRYILTSVVFLLLLAVSSQARLKRIAKDPYIGAIVIDCTTGKVIFEDKADASAYPASTVKIMDLLLILEMIDEGKATLGERIDFTKEACGVGGTQVWLDPRETGNFVLDDMLYALMLQSANDVAMALAMHYGGSRQGFIKMMYDRAKALGMKITVFRSPHGLPPDEKKKQKPDVTTARDMAILGLEIVKHPRALVYTSTKEKWFRDNKVQMINHNKLLSRVKGCDGLKTGYIRIAGSSIVATAKRDDRRIVVAIMGSSSSKRRDAVTKEIMEKAFLNLPPPEEAKAVVVGEQEGSGDESLDAAGGTPRKPLSKGLLIRGGVVGLAVLLLLGISRHAMKKRFKKYEFY
jgi:D-alanyl-D-alanine carboxypeptidase (penicillin-binding protein 5/6)